MFPTWRIKIREAQIALKEGRWDEALQVLEQESVRDFLPAKRLSRQVASHLIERARHRIEGGQSTAGWIDLQQAARLGGRDDQVAALRLCHARRGLDRVRNLLQRGEITLAQDEIVRLEHQRLGGGERRTWKRVLDYLLRAKKLASQGEAATAAEQLGRAAGLLPDAEEALAEQIASQQTKVLSTAGQLQNLSRELHEALSQQAWTDVLTTAQALLELAPEHPAARRARRKAWKVVGMDTTQAYLGPRPKGQVALWSNLADQDGRQSNTSTRRGASSPQVETVNNQREPDKRIVAWIDVVGGYLLCLDDEVILGQPSSGADIAILADLSRRHASIRRDGDSYVLIPIHGAKVDGVALTGPTVLRSGALIELGDCVRLRFRKPHALSATAVLTLDSHHKTDPAVDSIVLMSENCILGPQEHSHICCRHWKEDIVLFRRDEHLQLRTQASLEVNGQAVGCEAVVVGDCHVAGEDFAMSFEFLSS